MSGSRRQTTIGDYIKQRIVPEGMTVTEAARILGVTRVALSSLLNGRASLSRQMALRLKTAFGADADELLEYQEEVLRERRREEERKLTIRSYVPPFLKITASQIHEWGSKGDEARSRLPVLLRRLIRSTGAELRHVSFPGFGEAQRHGWDGQVEARMATPWIPEGKSGWELSTRRDSGVKANEDFGGPRSDLPEDVRAETTFVFVSSRKWPGKTDWEVARKAEGRWKDVRALDASDLEQWLEDSIEGQVWMGEQLALPSLNDCMTLDRAWERWANGSELRMTDRLFAPAVAEHRDRVVVWLERDAPVEPLLVAADSKDEALAFLACLFRDNDFPEAFRDHAMVVDSPQTLQTLAPSTSRFIPVVAGKEAESELASLYRQRHCIVVRPRNAVDRQPGVELGLLRPDSFGEALEAMGFSRDNADRLARESGRSPTVLRRRLSKIDAIREPHWADETEVARRLAPMMLVGAWNEGSAADREVLGALANTPYDEIEKKVADFLTFDDAPVWTVAGHRGVVSKIDALFAVGRHLTRKDVEDFLDLAEYVLSEADPALEMPRTRRWTAGFYGKVRDHSSALRTGLCETLVLLAVHGNGMFQVRLGIDVEGQVSALVRRLLRPEGDEAPLTTETLESYERDLPMLAEAAPDEFLCLLEEDLDLPDSAVLELLAPVEATLFSRWPGTGVLWALECLAWSPSNLSRVALILARMSTAMIDDNQANRPLRSLETVFRYWKPQTAATLEQRSQVLQLLCRRVPEVGWHLCTKQVAGGLRGLGPSHRPRWRGDASGAGQPVPRREQLEFRLKALEQMLDWQPGYDAAKLADLIENLGVMPESNQTQVWSLVDDWLSAPPSDSETAELRERLRRFAFARRGRFAAAKPQVREGIRKMCERLLPADPVSRYAWLFARYLIEEWPEDTDEPADWRQQEARIQERRTEAMREILESEGLRGALGLLPGSEVADEVGRHVALCTPCLSAKAEALQACLSNDLPAGMDLESGKLGAFVGGFMFAVQKDARERLLSRVAERLDPDEVAFLLKWAPFEEWTWRAASNQGAEAAKAYWREVRPHRGREFSDSERAELLDRFLEADRPRAAFFAVSLFWDSVETSRLRELLERIATGSGKAEADLGLNPHDLQRAIESLNGRPGVTREEMAHLEFGFYEALQFSEYGTPNLERHLAESSSDFVWLVSLVYKRGDGGEDPEGWPVKGPHRRSTLVHSALSVLDEMTRIPGTHGDEIRAEELQAWVDEVRRLGKEFGRSGMTDYCVGKLLSKQPHDGASWPCRPVCEVMETIRSNDVLRGFVSGVIEARGAFWRSAGDTQERDLAVRYRSWASRLAAEFPFIGRVLEKVAQSYDGSAAHWDTFDKLGERLGG